MLPRPVFRSSMTLLSAAPAFAASDSEDGLSSAAGGYTALPESATVMLGCVASLLSTVSVPV